MNRLKCSKTFFLVSIAVLSIGCIGESEPSNSDSGFYLSVSASFLSPDFYSGDAKDKDYGTKFGVGYMFEETGGVQWGLSASMWDVPNVSDIKSMYVEDYSIPLVFDTFLRADYTSLAVEVRRYLGGDLDGVIQIGGVYTQIKTTAEAFFEENQTTSKLFPNLTAPVVVTDRETSLDPFISIGFSVSLYPPPEIGNSLIKKGETFIMISQKYGTLRQSSIDIGVRAYF